MTLSDSLFSIGLLLQDEAEIFTLLPQGTTPSTFTDDAIESITGSVVFQFERDRLLVTRTVYNVLDYLGDIGGLFGTFSGLASVFTLILNFNGVYHLMTSSLFSVETDIAGASDSSLVRRDSSASPGYPVPRKITHSKPSSLA